MSGPRRDDEVGGVAKLSRRTALLVGGAALLGACTPPEGSSGQPAVRTPTTATPGRPRASDLASADVMDFGARGDGATDDTAAIQRALDSVRVGGTVTFPAGVYRVARGSRTRFLTFRPGTILAGDGMRASVLKPVDRAGPWRDFLGPARTDQAAAGIVVRDLGFDMNTRTNPVTSDPVASGMSRCVVYCPAALGSQVIVERCRFVDCSNVNTLYLAGSIVEVHHCRFEGTGAGALAVWDHSSIYAVARIGGHIGIETNDFEGTLGSGGSRTAIETHGGSQTVTSNHVDAYLVGMNLTGIASSATDGVEVAGNTITDALIGMQVWSGSEPSASQSPLDPAAPGAVTRDINIRSNSMTIDADAWNSVARQLRVPASGVLFNLAPETPIAGMLIAANRVSYLPSHTTSPDTDERSAGVSFAGDGIIRGLTITGNSFDSPISSAILLNGNVSDVVVLGNSVLNPGSGSLDTVSPQYRALLTLGGRIDGLTIADNVTMDDRSRHVMTREVSTLGGTTVVGPQVIRNGQLKLG